MKHKILNIIVLASLFILMAPPVPARAQASHSVRVGLLTRIDQLDPLFAQTNAEVLITEQLFLGLTGIDENGKPIAELAESWEVSEDGLTWVFHLRQGVQWVDSNGGAQGVVTASDVALSIDRALGSGVSVDLLGKASAVDDYTVVFSLNTPSSNFDILLANLPYARPVPSKLISAVGDSVDQPGVIWSNAAYLLTERTGQSVRLQANPYSPDSSLVQAQGAHVGCIENPDDALRRYRGGDLDLIEVTAAQRDLIQSDPALAPELRLVPVLGGLPEFTIVAVAPSAQVATRAYLVKTYIQPTYSSSFGLGGFHQWGLTYSDPSVIIPDTTRILDDETLNALQSVENEQSVLTFERMTSQLSVVQIGDIVVGNTTLGRGNEAVAPYGFLRRVTNFFTDAEGRFLLETKQAALDEAIERGGQSFSGTFQFDDVYKVEDPPTAFLPPHNGPVMVNYIPPTSDFRVTIDQVVYDYDEDYSTTFDQVRARGWIDFEPEMSYDFRVDVDAYQLQYLRFSSVVKESSRVELSSNVEIAGFNQTFALKRFTFIPQVVWIGPMPVVITPQLTINVGAKGDITVGVSTGIEQNATLTAGVLYEAQTWNPISAFEDRGFGPLETTLTHKARAEAFAGPELSIKFYGVAGPYGKVKSYLNLAADPLAAPWWTLAGGVKAEFGIKVEVFSHVVASYNQEYPIIEERILAQSDGPIPTQPTYTPPPVPRPDRSCRSSWWPLTCWPWWLWAIVVIVVLIIAFKIFGG